MFEFARICKCRCFGLILKFSFGYCKAWSYNIKEIGSLEMKFRKMVQNYDIFNYKGA